MEPYLLCVTKTEKRQCLSKLRCSNHSLIIEVGRHKKLQVNERLCPKCNEIEDEIQFISSCALFDTVRKKFIQEIIEIDQTFSQLDDEEFFIKLMTNNNCLILGKLLPFIRACFEIRRILGVGLKYHCKRCNLHGSMYFLLIEDIELLQAFNALDLDATKVVQIIKRT